MAIFFSVSSIVVLALLIAVAPLTRAQTVTVQLVEESGQPLQVHTRGSITDVSGLHLIGTGLQEFDKHHFLGYSKGFFLVAGNVTFKAYETKRYSTTSMISREDLSGCQDFLRGGVVVELQGEGSAETAIGFTSDAPTTAGIILPTGYQVGDPLDGVATASAISTLAELGLTSDSSCFFEWTGADSGETQRVELVATTGKSNRTQLIDSSRGPIRPVVQVARLELHEEEDSITVQSSGFLSDVDALGDAIVNYQHALFEESVLAVGNGFHTSLSTEEADLFVISAGNFSVSGCEGFSIFYTFEFEESTVPTFGFDALFSDVIINLPTDYKAGSSLSGRGKIINASFADVNITEGDVCYVEWMGSNQVKQRVELVAASAIATTIYLTFESSQDLVGIDVPSVDEVCGRFLTSKGLTEHDITCVVTQGIAGESWVEFQTLVTSFSSQVSEDMFVESILASFASGQFADLDEDVLRPVDLTLVSGAPSERFADSKKKEQMEFDPPGM